MSQDTPRHFASPPCGMHEVDPGYGGLTADSAPSDWRAWRVQQRRRLLEARLALGQEARAAHTRRIIAQLRAKLDAGRASVISFYWPMRGEPDLRPLLGELSAAGVRCALPVVDTRGEPLVFRSWAPGESLTRGVWNIPVPAQGDVLTPDIVIAPVIGFDPGRYRLGYGGGYFDRTLAAFCHEPRVIGVGYPNAALATIHPQPHDIPMHLIVTGQAGAHPEPSE
jgi:5-formyltetrahydrofolate cyclo-ligase